MYNIDQTCSQKRLDISPLWVNQGVSIVSILENLYRVIKKSGYNAC